MSADGDWNEWIRFFAEGIEASATDTSQRIAALLRIQVEYEARIRDSGAKGLILDLANFLIGNPYVTIPTMAAATGFTYQAVSTATRKLVELQILEDLGSAGGVKRFRATAVYRAVSAADAPLAAA